ncbi:MAG: hypothetical protein ONB48_17940 [candidate division KSB1 bacterium]|nr:hypothetical protein [candidate division KSB1 bacterium]MDZ7275772.1 hypothetical protein [candidate division KSB1 bacterium]MDZ7287525.1 hypothetical protein [candidate division KSB1 bacterium]MDZ7350503.1 hypothetical protein [candidate division KSB1 bacterium]MDZ7354875.1 hypothetical protein [candidate division KSB1 bacterium]
MLQKDFGRMKFPIDGCLHVVFAYAKQAQRPSLSNGSSLIATLWLSKSNSQANFPGAAKAQPQKINRRKQSKQRVWRLENFLAPQALLSLFFPGLKVFVFLQRLNFLGCPLHSYSETPLFILKSRSCKNDNLPLPQEMQAQAGSCGYNCLIS